MAVSRNIDDFGAVREDVRHYGEANDAVQLNARAIQDAIDACHEAGGGVVVCGPGTYRTGAFSLKSNVELHLAPGCVVLGSERIDDYATLEAEGFRAQNAPELSAQALVLAAGARNIAITGPGEIRLPGLAFFDTNNQPGRFFAKPDTPRPRTVMFYRCRDVRLTDTAYIDSPLWTIWLMQCERVRVRGIRIEADQRMINNDGLHIDACRDVTVSDSTFKTGDDCIIARALQRVYETPAICENVTVANCVLDSWCQGIRVGVTGDHIVRNCAFTNLVITSGNNGINMFNHARYRRETDTTALDLSNVMFSNLRIECENIPLWLGAEEGVALARLQGVSFSDARIVSGGPITLAGSSQTIPRDISLSNVAVESTGDTPLACRNCRDVRLVNVSLAAGANP